MSLLHPHRWRWRSRRGREPGDGFFECHDCAVRAHWPGAKLACSASNRSGRVTLLAGERGMELQRALAACSDGTSGAGLRIGGSLGNGGRWKQAAYKRSGRR